MRWVSALAFLVLVGCAAPQAPPPLPTATSIPTTVPTVPPTATPVPIVLEPKTPTGDYFLGQPTAPVTLEMFGDFQCPVCGEFARTTEPPFMQNYVNPGKVKF